MFIFNDKIKKLTPYTPVKDTCTIHLDANESFLQLPVPVRAEMSMAFSTMALNRYPDPTCRAVCSAFADYYDVPKENVAAGNGSDELITVIFSSFLEKGDSYAVIEPDFSMYRFYGQICEANPVIIEKRPDFTINVDSVVKTCNNKNVKLLIFSNPCNPTSIGLKRDKVRQIVENVNALVVLDEAYMDFWDESLLSEVENYDNLIILRTCSKAFGMAGVRLGFAVARREIISVLMTVKSPYNVNVVTQRIGEIALRYQSEAQTAIAELLRSKAALYSGIKKLEEETRAFITLPSDTNFVTMVMEKPEDFYCFLTDAGIAVRFTSGLIRVTCGTEEENRIFIDTANKYFKKEGD